MDSLRRRMAKAADDAIVVPVGTTFNFNYTGTVQEVTLSAGTYQLQCWGAQGADYGSKYIGGRGAYAAGELTLQETTVLYVYIGGQGVKAEDSTMSPGGFNGGGAAYVQSFYGGCSGGGATDIRIGTDSLYARVIVAGGGGGGFNGKSGGYGGGGFASDETSYKAGRGGAMSHAGESYNGSSKVTENSANYYIAGFGFGGGSAGNKPLTGGGGGWYGGGFAYRNAGGGGSNYIFTANYHRYYPSGCLLDSSYYLSNAIQITGNVSFTNIAGTANETGHSDNGYAKITRLS